MEQDNELLQMRISFINKLLDKVDTILSKNLSVEERRKYIILANLLEDEYRRLEEINLNRNKVL